MRGSAPAGGSPGDAAPAGASPAAVTGRRGGGPGAAQLAAAGRAGGRAAPPLGQRLTYPGPRGSVAATLRQIHQEQQRQQERASPGAAPGPRHHRPSVRRRGRGGTEGLCGHRRRLRRAAAPQPGSGASVGGRCPGPALPPPATAGYPPRPWGCPL